MGVFGVAEPSWLLAAVLLAAAVAYLLGKALVVVGFRYSEAALLLVAAPLLSASDLPWFFTVDNGSIIAANAAGFAIPVVVAAKLMLEGRARVVPTLTATAFVSLIAFPMSSAVPNQGILLYYRLPALAAAGAAVVLCWRRWDEAGPVAFVSGAGGVIFGADLSRLPELLAAEGARRVVIGGAGILDGIFLVAVLAALLSVGASGIDRMLVRLRRSEPADTEFTLVREA